jgi:hypothetical protein
METSESLPAPNSSPSISSAEGSPVRTSAKPESEPELKALAAAFGLSSPALLGHFDPDSFLLRMSQACLFQEQCPEWSESWPDSGMWDAGSVYALRTSEPATSESGFSSWPTPSVPNGGRTTNTSNYREDGSKRQVDLGAIAQIWPTPRAITSGGESAERKQELGREESGGGDLQATAQLWKTPHGMSNRDFRGKVGGCGGGEFAKQANNWATPQGHPRQADPRTVDHGVQLANQVGRWPTASARDWKSGDANEATMNRNSRPLNEVVEHLTWPTPRHTTSGMEVSDAQLNRIRNGEETEGGAGACKLELSACLHSPPAPQTPDGLTSSEIAPTSPQPSASAKKTGSESTASGSPPGARLLKRRLNPRFVEWLMGFPVTWTEL